MTIEHIILLVTSSNDGVVDSVRSLVTMSRQEGGDMRNTVIVMAAVLVLYIMTCIRQFRRFSR